MVNKTPMATTTKLDKDEQGKNIDTILYRSMISSLLYLMASRLDIMFSAYLCARFQSCPKESHLIAVKCIIRYLKGTTSEDMTILNDEFFGCRLCQLQSGQEEHQ